jgi:hypothetical protein
MFKGVIPVRRIVIQCVFRDKPIRLRKADANYALIKGRPQVLDAIDYGDNLIILTRQRNISPSSEACRTAARRQNAAVARL